MISSNDLFVEARILSFDSRDELVSWCLSKISQPVICFYGDPEIFCADDFNNWSSVFDLSHAVDDSWFMNSDESLRSVVILYIDFTEVK